MINADEYHFGDSAENTKIPMLIKTETETTVNPEKFMFDVTDVFM